MGRSELARAVAERAGLSREESADLTRAVLEAFAGQLSSGEARRLAAELPGMVAEPWPLSPRHRTGAHPVPVDEFIDQVSGRTGLTAEETRTGTGALLAVLAERLGEDGYRHLTGQLPRAYAELAESAR
ncbi:MAG TPA: DUF2267 domain-containing protein [Streptosporangiaceae bacterium]